MGEADTRILDLTKPRLAAELHGDFVDLGQPGNDRRERARLGADDRRRVALVGHAVVVAVRARPVIDVALIQPVVPIKLPWEVVL